MHDDYFLRAKREGYRARSVYKLIEIQDNFKRYRNIEQRAFYLDDGALAYYDPDKKFTKEARDVDSVLDSFNEIYKNSKDELAIISLGCGSCEIEKKVLDITNGKIIGLVVETKCNYYHPAAFPDQLTVGFSVKKIGNSSVIYNLGIFKKNKIIAEGHFVHVYVDRKNRKPTNINPKFRAILQEILV